MLDDAWLAGLLYARGSFTHARAKGKYYPRVEITLPASERRLLERIADSLGGARVHAAKRGSLRLTTSNVETVRVLVAYLDRFPSPTSDRVAGWRDRYGL